MNGCDSPGCDDGSMGLVPNIVREVKPSPSSKRIKLGNDIPFARFKEEPKQTNKGHNSQAWNSNQVSFGLFLFCLFLSFIYNMWIN